MLRTLAIAVLLVIVNISVCLAYVGNKRSYIFHRDSCYHVDQMAERNMYYTDDRDELIDMGMRPCRNCRP